VSFLPRGEKEVGKSERVGGGGGELELEVHLFVANNKRSTTDGNAKEREAVATNASLTKEVEVRSYGFLGGAG
jgi:hypothetical protein